MESAKNASPSSSGSSPADTLASTDQPLSTPDTDVAEQLEGRGSAETDQISEARARTSASEWLLRGVCVAVMIFIAWLVYGYAFANGVCCADDSSIAVAAKKVAEGRGYASSVSFFGGAPGLTLFDPALSTGPTLVLPAALTIRVFGNTPWAPGVSAATVSFIVIIGIIVAVQRFAGLTRSLLSAAFLVILMYFATAGSVFSQWYAILGEIPAALLTILGVALIARRRPSLLVVGLGGLSLGLALTAKTLALLVAVPFFAFLIARVLMKGERRRRLLVLCVAAAAYCAPAGLFELWKLLVLGWSGYIANLRAWWRFFRGASDGATTTVSGNLHVFHSYFEFTLFTLVTAVVVVGVVAITAQRSSSEALQFFGILAAGAFLDLTWFLLSAPENARYALIGTVVGLAAIACIALTRAHRLTAMLVAVACAIALSGSPTRMVDPVKFVASSGFRDTPRVVNLRTAADWLTEHRTGQRYVSSWWATVVDLEYMMPTAENFVPYTEVPDDQMSGRILVRNIWWAALATTPRFTELEKRCNKVLLFANPYLITQCP